MNNNQQVPNSEHVKLIYTSQFHTALNAQKQLTGHLKCIGEIILLGGNSGSSHRQGGNGQRLG
ncbi:hypothetical protein [Pseudomonas grimontii]|uniref:hypothetical protein n=1 Tax=Pseudomonas grimontii TaxID=129847 RepID=UPI00387B1279